MHICALHQFLVILTPVVNFTKLLEHSTPYISKVIVNLLAQKLFKNVDEIDTFILFIDGKFEE